MLSLVARCNDTTMTDNKRTSTIAQLHREGTSGLAGDDAAREAELLLAAALGKDRAWLRAHGDDVLPVETKKRYRAWLERRAAGEPVAYLLGQREFWSLPLVVTPSVLIPRADTERLVELALERLPDDRPCRVADLGTGSGAIALAIAHERPLADVTATDASADALAVARGNAERLGLGERVRFQRGDWFEALTGIDPFDVIVSNPPYIAADDQHLREGDLRYEPAAALISGVDGLDAIRHIISNAPAHLTRDGWLLIEHGHTQAAAVRALMQASGFADVASATDLAGIERVTLARRPG